MYDWQILELEALLRTGQSEPRRVQPLRPAAPTRPWRRHVAGWLIGLGLHLDAEASRAAIGRMDIAPRLNGSDA